MRVRVESGIGLIGVGQLVGTQVHRHTYTHKLYLEEIPPLPPRGDGLVEVHLRIVGAALPLVRQRLVGLLHCLCVFCVVVG